MAELKVDSGKMPMQESPSLGLDSSGGQLTIVTGTGTVGTGITTAGRDCPAGIKDGSEAGGNVPSQSHLASAVLSRLRLSQVQDTVASDVTWPFAVSVCMKRHAT